MKNYKKLAITSICGLVYGLLTVFLAGLLLRHLGLLGGWIGKMLALDDSVLDQVGLALGQLRQAQIVSPWLLALVTAAAAGGLSLCGKRGMWATVILGIVLFLPVVLGAACLTKVNGIHFGALLRQLIALLPALL